MADPAGTPPPPASPAPGGPSGPRASFGTRFLAWLVDVLILLPVNLIIAFILPRGLDNVLTFIVGLAYLVYLEGSPSGQTVGKRALNIRVVDARSMGSIDYTRAFIRYIGRILSSIPCLLGFFWMLWDSEKQTWHDKIATTYVVPTSAYPVEKWPG